ncbi:MAG TPA: VacJ family lipoprotein [Rubrivivax sp.]
MRHLFALGALVLLGTGCATTAPGADGAAAAPPVRTPSPADPWEGMNRSIFAFNDAFDRGLLRPVAEGYEEYVPSPIRTGIGNVFSNVSDGWSSVNQLLQGKFLLSAEMGSRFLINTTLGIYGLFDWASEMRIERNREDFGQTLGYWGVGTGPYFVIPFVGPSTVRDTAGFAVDREISVGNIFTSRKYFNWLTALELVEVRADFLPASKLVDQIALDKYSFLRDGFLARRLNDVHDGNPPKVPEAPEAPASQVPPAPK